MPELVLLCIIITMIGISWYYIVRPDIQVSRTGVVTFHWSSYNTKDSSIYRKSSYIMTIENETILNLIEKWKNKKLPY